MRLEAAGLALPSRRLSNADIVELVRQHSAGAAGDAIEPLLRRVQALLGRAGARTRCWLAEDETPLGLIEQAVAQALATAGRRRSEVDVLINVGVDRGFAEPANAYFVAHALGMDRVACFDVLDACNGWVRAAQLAQALLATGVYRTALLVAAEFGMWEGGAVYPGLFRLRSAAELAWRLPAYTFGEGATATLLAAGDAPAWEFRWSSRAELADLCSVPLDGYWRYAWPSDTIARDGVRSFAAHGSAMLKHALRELPRLAAELTTPLDQIRLLVPHAVARPRALVELAEQYGFGGRAYYLFPRCGNLVSASIPAALALAAAEGRLQPGDRVLSCVGSAGMSFSLASFVYRPN